MDLKNPKYLQGSSFLQSTKDSPPLEGNSGNSFYSKNKENPFEVADTFTDPLCKINLKETSDFVKSFPMTNTKRDGVSSLVSNRRLEAPSTPGRPVFSFSVGNGNLSRKGFPSKWDNAEKWIVSTSCHDSPAHLIKPTIVSKQNETFQQKGNVFTEKSRVSEEKVSNEVLSFNGSVASLDHSVSGFNGGSAEVLLKDKFTDNIEPFIPNFRYSEPTKEGFLFRNSACESMKDSSTEMVRQIEHKDVGTEMTPLGSSTTSRCHTPFKSFSPARHNTPANRSGPLSTSNNTSTTIAISELQECHFAKLELGTHFDSVTSNWSSREEEEEEISKSLRHFDMDNGYPKNAVESKASVWEEEERTKCCYRYQREEAKIQAWVNLQSAKAEAQSKKLEVKIQKMRSNLEEKLMRRMAIVHRKAEDMRTTAQVQHSQQIQRAKEQAKNMKNPQNFCISDHTSCGCFPCNNYHL